MSAGHDHTSEEIRYEKPLWWALGLTATFLIAEVVGGLLTNSLALLSDAAHMMTDVLALMVSLVAVRWSRRPPDARRTYGYARMEALGAIPTSYERRSPRQPTRSSTSTTARCRWSAHPAATRPRMHSVPLRSSIRCSVLRRSHG